MTEIEREARAIADGLQNYIAEPRRTELAEDIAAAIREAVETAVEEERQFHREAERSGADG